MKSFTTLTSTSFVLGAYVALNGHYARSFVIPSASFVGHHSHSMTTSSSLLWMGQQGRPSSNDDFGDGSTWTNDDFLESLSRNHVPPPTSDSGIGGETKKSSSTLSSAGVNKFLDSLACNSRPSSSSGDIKRKEMLQQDASSSIDSSANELDTDAFQ